MTLEKITGELTVCRIPDLSGFDPSRSFFFLSRTDDEISLVCRTEDVPAVTSHREDGWRAFRVAGPLDFSLTGILSRISGTLADNGIGIFAVSTYDTDYILVKKENYGRALQLLEDAGWSVR